MSKKIFNPQEWATATPSQSTNDIQFVQPFLSSNNDIEEITKRIEANQTDIAPNYADWRDLGFALADALGENGRTYYHRLSRSYSGYTETETDRQFDNCLKAHGHGVTIKTLFHLAKQAGISVAVDSGQAPQKSNYQISISPNLQSGNLTKWQNGEIKNEALQESNLPTFPSEIYSELPDFLQQITRYALSPEDADLLLLGTLTVVSACLPNVYGIYGGVTAYPNLFLFVTAQASAGKGRLSLCRRLVEPIHKQLRDINQLEYEEYRRKQAEYVANKKNPDAEPPIEPPLRVLFVPANSSATAVFQILNDNKGVGLMFETEGDTLAQTFKSEHGNYSDGFRKAFHHEKISYLRRKDREYVTLETPKLSALLSGTPRQIQSLIPDAENGLFSRFMFYFMNIRLEWLDVFATPNGGESLDQIFDRFGLHFFEFYRSLQQTESLRFTLTASQQVEFNAYFQETQLQYFDLCGQDYLGTVRRLGVITFRIALVLSVLRILQTGDFASPLVCNDTDFQTAMSIVKVLICHAAHVFAMLPRAETATPPKSVLLDSLPPTFDRTAYIQAAQRLGIPDSTADKQIARCVSAGLLTRQKHGEYSKTESNAKAPN